MSKANLFSALAVAFCLLIVVLGCSGRRQTDTVTSSPTPATRTPAKNTETAAPASPASGVTMTNFTKLQTGMSYPEVVGILGKEGEEISSNDIAGVKTVMYKWDGDGGSWGANMNAMFQKGKLLQKSQFGLK